MGGTEGSEATVASDTIDLALPVEARPAPPFDRPLTVGVRSAALLNGAPWARSLGKLPLEVTTQCMLS